MLRIAHRAGNDVDRLVPALQAGADLIEADVRRHRGRLEVRHDRRRGPMDPVLFLHALVEALPPDAHLMLDLKGRDPRLGRAVRAAMAVAAPEVPYTVCGRAWSMLTAFDGLAHVRVVHSAGNRVELVRLLRRLRRRNTWGVSVHRALLTPQRVAWLHERAEVVMTWPVNTASELASATAAGVDGVISDRLQDLADLLAPRG